VPATCTTAGSYDKVTYCLVCNEVATRLTLQVPPTAHSFADLQVTAPTCTTDGYITITCEVCGLVQDSRYHQAAKDFAAAYPYFKLDATGHKHNAVVTEPTCTEDGYTTYTCRCGDSYKANPTPATGHKVVVDKAVEPTCTTEGWTEGKHCRNCGLEIVAQKPLEKLNHVVVVDKAVAPTCTQTGLTEGKHCGECGKVLVAQYKVAKTNHTFVDGECTHCGEKDAAYIPESYKISVVAAGGILLAAVVAIICVKAKKRKRKAK
jgi:hypothetical protein